MGSTVNTHSPTTLNGNSDPPLGLLNRKSRSLPQYPTLRRSYRPVRPRFLSLLPFFSEVSYLPQWSRINRVRLHALAIHIAHERLRPRCRFCMASFQKESRGEDTRL